MTSFSFYGSLQKDGTDEPFSIQFEAETLNEARKMFDNLITNIEKWCEMKICLGLIMTPIFQK